MNRLPLEIGGLPPSVHHCTSFVENDWIVWRCPHCSGYERRYNSQTGEMKIRRGGSEAQHTGLNTGRQNVEALTQNLSKN